MPTERYCDRIKSAGEGRIGGAVETNGVDNGEKAPKPVKTKIAAIQ